MILYVNGDSHTAAAEAVNQHAFAQDDAQLFYLGRTPHPANLAVSWGRVLADTLKATFKCDAESASSNARILRTARAWAQAHRHRRDHVMILQWSTWERAEWSIDGELYQINASGTDHVPASHEAQYRQWILDIDWQHCSQQAHDEIWQFHQELDDMGVRHLFFNGNSAFQCIAKSQRHRWGTSYIEPYSPDHTYSQWLLRNGYQTVSPNSWHFGPEAHAAWSHFVLQYCISHRIITP